MKEHAKNSKQEPKGLVNLGGILGWLFLVAGLVLYVVPLFYDFFGFHSGLFAFLLIFIGISLLKYRKDQLNR